MIKKTMIASTLSMFLLVPALAETSITLLNTRDHTKILNDQTIKEMIHRSFDVSHYREIKVQEIHTSTHQIDHLLVYLFSKEYHHVEFAKITLDTQHKMQSIVMHYTPTRTDFANQPAVHDAQCPNPYVEFIAFAPNDNNLEQSVTIDVADAAELHGMVAVRLLKEDATRQNYLNYMACPNLKGNFYDGDADSTAITTYDGLLSSDDIANDLNAKFRYKVTNVWVACEAYNDPMKSTVLNTAQAQKYGAGVNKLLVGPSDLTGACAMKAFMDNNPMTDAFQACYDQLDDKSDIWGFGGDGSDYFGQ